MREELVKSGEVRKATGERLKVMEEEPVDGLVQLDSVVMKRGKIESVVRIVVRQPVSILDDFLNCHGADIARAYRNGLAEAYYGHRLSCLVNLTPGSGVGSTSVTWP